MPVIVVLSWYPPDKGPEIGPAMQRVQEKITPDESLGTMLLPTVFTSGKDGIFTITAFQPAEGKVGEALAQIADICYFYQGIEGFRYEIKTYVTLEEAGARATRLGG
jgi:hypothetical protein